jgi:hypothetical protein
MNAMDSTSSPKVSNYTILDVDLFQESFHHFFASETPVETVLALLPELNIPSVEPLYVLVKYWM